jgi:hypothetical protein
VDAKGAWRMQYIQQGVRVFHDISAKDRKAAVTEAMRQKIKEIVAFAPRKRDDKFNVRNREN